MKDGLDEYMASFFDGEGCIHLQVNQRQMAEAPTSEQEQTDNQATLGDW